MANKSNSLIKDNYFLKPGFIFIPKKTTDISVVLGSSVAVCIYDKERMTGGINHFQFPIIYEKNKATIRYGNVATITLINMLFNDGSKIKYIEAQVFGGAYNHKVSSKDIGKDNITVAKAVLAKKKIRVASEDVGGKKGRKIIFNTYSGEVAVLKVDKIRKRDWHPYEDDR